MNGLYLSSVARKFWMALTGLLLLGFVVAHMLGNLQIYMGPDAINGYAHHLKSLPGLLWPARIFLLLITIIHIFCAITLAVENKKARPTPYLVRTTVQATYESRTMVVSGVIVLAFIIYHLLHFTFGVTHPELSSRLDSHGHMDVYSMVVLSFRQWPVTFFYILAMALLCAHLRHGIKSVFQTLGVKDASVSSSIQWAATLISLAIFAGNSSIAICSLLGILKVAL